MTLAGTRPILPDELEQYELHHRARIAIKPGITGMWQVSGRSDITDLASKLKEIDPVRGENLARNLERGLMAIPLVAHEALTTAYINDVDGLGVFAQQLYGFGRPGDGSICSCDYNGCYYGCHQYGF